MPIAAWLVGLLGSALGSLMTWLMQKVVYERALNFALTTAFLLVFAGMTLGITLSIKAAILGARYGMPNVLASGTYFLPSNLPVILSLIVNIKISATLYRWTVNGIRAYLPTNPNIGMRGAGLM